MDRTQDQQTLAGKLTPREGAAARIGAIVAHPHFPAAARALARNMLAVGERDKALDGIFKDAGRYVAAMWAMYLHIDGGLTLPRLKAAAASSGYLSPGRARAMLLYLRHLGYVAPDAGRATPTRFVPTETFVAAWREHLRAALEAVRIVEPMVAIVLDQLDDRAVFDCLARIQGEGLLEAARGATQEVAFVRVFQHRYAGSQVIFTLVLAGNDAFPPLAPVAFSLAATARRFGVSRIHIKRMLDEAAREGLLACEPDGAVRLSETARLTIAFLYALQLAQLAAAATATAAELSLQPAVAA